MYILVLLLLLLAIVIGPGIWVQRVMSRYSEPADRYQGTGAELARHLLDQLKLNDVQVELTDRGDHYDPEKKVVRLSDQHFNSASLTAITVAAHEVGHAMQDQDNYAPLIWRGRLVRLAGPLQKLAAAIMFAAPVLTVITRTPVTGVAMFAAGFLFLVLMPLLHLVTLPVELDASFGRALPMLTRGGFLQRGDEPYARKILTAAACTYVAASLISLINVGRWWAILRS